VLSQLSVSFEVFKLMFFRLTLPIKTDVKLGFDKNKSSLSFINNDAFRFDFTFMGGSWFRGSSIPISAYGVLDRFDDQYAFTKEMGTITLNCHFSGSFKYPEIDESFTDHYNWGLTIKDFIQCNWDWKAYLRTMPDDIIFSIENYCKRILEILETTKKNA
ncbi:MAG: AlbA 2 protein, partial [Thermoproteota archaeon]|nr:AlbA 2 protein [Thermoproteota archaeon]